MSFKSFCVGKSLNVRSSKYWYRKLISFQNISSFPKKEFPFCSQPLVTDSFYLFTFGWCRWRNKVNSTDYLSLCTLYACHAEKDCSEGCLENIRIDFTYVMIAVFDVLGVLFNLLRLDICKTSSISYFCKNLEKNLDRKKFICDTWQKHFNKLSFDKSTWILVSINVLVT